MAYNVFKRPMFKRGGSTTGTGIMSHVEPRVNAAMGFPTFGLSKQPNQAEIDAFKKSEAQRIQNIRNQPNLFLGPRFTDPNYQSPFKNFFSTNTGFGFMNLSPKSSGQGIVANITGTGTGTDTGMPVDTGDLYDEMLNIQANEAAIKSVNKPPPAPDKDTGTKDGEYKASDIRSEVEKESDMLKELLKDDKYSKGEAALIIAGALAEPGTFADKVKKATELAAPVARKRREEDKAITLAAYKLAKEKEREEIKAGKGTDYIKNIEETAEAISKNPGETRSKEQIKNVLLAIKSPESTSRIAQLEKISPAIFDAAGDIARLQSELATAKTDKDRARIQSDIERKLNDIRVVSDYPEFDAVFPGIKKRVGLKAGGRAHFANGTEVEDDIVTSKVSFGSGSETTSEPVQQLSYQELRDRLPPGITDDVVNLIANNIEALQEFSYIRTQDDVNGFNTKYGVNLVIPPSRA